jgi:alanine racemase
VNTVCSSGRLTINLGAVGRNYRKLSSILAPSVTAAVVKANAYGLGAREVTTTLYQYGCRHFFVAQLQEAVTLRGGLPHDALIYVLNGLQPGSEGTCAESRAIPVLNSIDQLNRWSAEARHQKRTLTAVLQFDTGMSRLGFPPEERGRLRMVLQSRVDVEILFVMSHLASSDDPASRQNAAQLAEMKQIAEEFTDLDVCFANSGGVFLESDYHGFMARPGYALYGGMPVDLLPNPMEPVVRLDVAVIQTRTVPAGTHIGYGGTYITAKETRLATIAAGYADGLPRSLSSRGAVYFGGVRLPILGRVSMDSITIDIGALPKNALSPGSMVEVIGPHQTLEDLAEDAGTIGYELLTSLGDRYQRFYR